MELMADEMADFKTAILKLQLLSRQIFDLSIPISTEALEKNLNIFLQKQEAESQARDEILKEIDKKLKYARIIPNSLLFLFAILGLQALGMIGYFSYTNSAKRKESFEIYRRISESEKQLQQDFFAAHPEIKEEYCQWLDDQ